MKGLFLNCFYETWNNLKLVGALILGFGLSIIYSGNDTMVEIFPYITITAFAVSSIATLRKDTVSQWNKYELTLPVKRKNIIGSKYGGYTFWTLCGLIISAVFTFITFLIHGNLFEFGLRDGFSLFSLGVGLAILTGSIFFPLAIICGADKSEVLLAVSILLSIGLAIFIIHTVNRLNFNYKTRLIAFNFIYLIIYALSYLISFKLYLKKEF